MPTGAVMTTILYSETMYRDDSVEREVFGPDTRILMRGPKTLAALSDADCADVDGLMLFRLWASEADLARFPRLRVIVRMGVGYDRIDRATAAARGIMVCNVPDYGTMEVADHAVTLALALRRGLLLHHELQRATPPAGWTYAESPLIRRLSVQTFGIIGMGRIGMAAALRAKAFGFRVVFFDPYRPTGTELALGIERERTLDGLLRRADVLSLHAPLSPETRGMIGARELALLPQGAVLVNTARGPMVDIDAVGEALRSNHLAGAGLDVIPVEPPIEAPALLRAYRDREKWLEGRLIITPHSAFYSPQAWDDIRRKSAETMAAALTNQPQNVITPDMF
jgi:phosphoglycerate dehydrogenase-like enzyme